MSESIARQVYYSVRGINHPIHIQIEKQASIEVWLRVWRQIGQPVMVLVDTQVVNQIKQAVGGKS